MPLRFAFELDDEDLEYFQEIIAEKKVGQRDLEIMDIVEATRGLIQGAREARTPRFILEMLEKLEPLVDMVTDVEWRLPADDIKRVLTALAYFADPEDLIPDDLPGLGHLDDAVMVEIACRDLAPELHAYRDFCLYRAAELERRSAAGESQDAVSRMDWLESRRMELQDQMREKRTFFGMGKS